MCYDYLMVNVNKKYLNKDLQEKAWSRFIKEVKKSESIEALILNLRTFFTPSEITLLEKRLSIPVLIDKKLSYKAIGETLDVSPTTISFVKHNLTKKPVTHKKYSSSQNFEKSRKAKKIFLPYKGAESII